MEKVDINIELAHIYVNEDITSEHYQAVNLAKEIISTLKQQGKTYTVTVLIDDYNPTDWTLSVRRFRDVLISLGVRPDYLVYESKLVSHKEQILEEMHGKLRKKYHRYINKKGKCPCSFLIAVWYFVRLGIFDLDGLVSPKKNHPFAAEKIISILPQRYRSVEAKGLEIMQSTAYSSLIEGKIEQIFF